MNRRAPTNPPEPHPYRDALIAVGTRHGKAGQWAHAFDQHLGARLLTPADLDTDQFGTFTGEQSRRGTAVEAARAKAQLAMRVTGLPHGLASEASYGALLGAVVSEHQEVLVFVDGIRDIEIVVGHRTAHLPGISQQVTAVEELPPDMLAGLPQQALIVRPAHPHAEGAITKAITTRAQLRTAITAAMGNSSTDLAVVEPDLRAHHNPSRRIVLVRMGHTLAQRLATPCPRCGTPGFGRVDTRTGLPCRVCYTPTALPMSRVLGCTRCPHRSEHPLPAPLAEPSDCPHCNP